MSKFDECIAKYEKSLNDIGEDYDRELLLKVTKGLGPSIYNDDSSKVSSSDKEELARVKKSFLMKKLGLPDSEELDAAIQEVVEWYGKSNRNKFRAVFYYKLVLKFKKADVYN